MNTDLKKFHNLHFIGIGGIGMSALARYFSRVGKKVSGSDAVASDLTKSLSKEGIRVSIGHTTDNIPKEVDLVVYSQAIAANNPEMREAKKRGLPLLSYAEGLGEVTKTKYTIAVCGTHGKSTTTAMIALMLVAGGLDPTVIVGTKLKEFGNSNFRLGKSNFLVIEADEYRRSFLQYAPHLVVITNIDLDHLDYFKDEADYVKAFQQFVKNLPHGGHLVGNVDDEKVKKVVAKIKGEFLGVHFGENEFTLADRSIVTGRDLSLQVPGKHNQRNAALAFAVGKILNIPEKVIVQSLEKFSGTWRRFENKDKLPTGALCFDDYGHHPTEIQATLQGARQVFPDKRIICVFQPHQYSRTYYFLQEFGKAFQEADLVIIPNIYAARDSEKDKQKVSVADLLDTIGSSGKKVLDGQGLQKTAEWLLKNTHSHDVVLTMGAGDITTIYNYLV